MNPVSNASPVESECRERSTRDLIREKLVTWLRDEAGLPYHGIADDTPLSKIGIDSLGVAAMNCELEKETRKRPNQDIMFELETINQLADYLDSLPVVTEQAVPTKKPLEPMPSAGSNGESSPTPAPIIDKLEHFERLNSRVRSVKAQGLYFYEPVITQHEGAWVVADGQRMLMLGSYEYLGLLGHSHTKQAAIAAVQHFGTGHHGVRLLAGTTNLHRQLETKLAQWMRAQDAIVYSSGYVTNLATISTLVDRNCCVIGDEWNHASIVDGCRLSGAEFLIFKHNDMGSLAEQLRQASGRRTLVVVDAVFSMDGDIIDLPAVVKQCQQHGALLMVDEAHSLGVLGKTGHGIQEHFDLADGDIDIKMGTLSKTLASCGGFVAGHEEIVTFLRHHARGYVFSGALPTGQTAAAIAALEVIENEPGLVETLRKNVAYYLKGLRELGFDTGNTTTAIVPVMTKNEETTLAMTRLCRAAGLFVVPVVFPAVPLNAPRLRTCISSLHGQPELDFALQVLAQAGRQTGLIA